MKARVWPSMTDYAGAVQNPASTFRVPALAQATFATMPPLGLPAIASGQNAVVFTAHIGQTATAVRCFTTECADGRHRYRSLEQHLRSNEVPAMATASWLDDAVEINGQVWPVVTMEWVHGQQLQDYVADNYDNPAVLSALADEWVEACTSLRSASVAHGDLQHGNVIVESSGRVRLIDFDGIWVRDVDGSPPSEVGHPNYQHPGRKDTGAWGWSIDWFSAFGVYVALRGLASDRSLWDLHMGENLVFQEEDFWGDSDIWSRLERSSDSDVRAWSQLLAEGCGHDADAPYDLPTILNNGLVAAAAPTGSGQGPVNTAPTLPPRPIQSAPVASKPEAPSGSWWQAADDQSTPPVPPAAMPPPPIRPAAAPPPPIQPAATPDQSGVSAAWNFSVPSDQGSVPASGSSPATGSSGGGSPGGGAVRPPKRQAPQKQAVHSNWDDPSAATDPGPVPSAAPPTGSPAGPSPQWGTTPGPFGTKPPPPPPGASRPAGGGPNKSVTAAGYALIILITIAVVIALAVLGEG